MYSIINGIQVIKLFGWEKAFDRVVNEIRKYEIKAIAKGYYVKATLMSFDILTSFAVFVTLVLYVSLENNSLTAQKAFVTIAYFKYVNQYLVHFWPMAITSLADGWISLKRVETFLTQNNVSQKASKKETCELSMEITLKNASAFWNKEDQNRCGIDSVNLSIKPKELTAIIGTVGSGKTTLLEVILKELPLTEGVLEVGGTISYAAQQAWIFEGSIKNNIIFIEDFDENRYRKVVDICALDRDLKQLPHGDETIVGERGISLSGGQKARISLARAIYKKADIYLLDDIFSAVDTVVGSSIFEDVIKKFLKVSFPTLQFLTALTITFIKNQNSTCLLVTHQLQYLCDVKNIFVMEKGTVKPLQNSQEYFENFMKNTKEKEVKGTANQDEVRLDSTPSQVN